MRIPGADKAIDNLLAWSQREEWTALREQVLADHFDEIFERTGITMDGIARQLGEGAIRMVLGCVVEDFFAARFGEDGENVIDDYLRRRGWKEKVAARRYLEAMRDSAISLHEVVDLVPGQQMTVRDLIRGGEPVVVKEKLGSETAARWDCIAARVVTVNGQTYFTGGMLLFGRTLADEYVASVNTMLKAAKRGLVAEAKARGETLAISDHEVREAFLDGASPMLVQMWLADALDLASRPMPEVRNAEGDEIVFAEIRFPIIATAAEIVERLDACPDLDRDGSDPPHWAWLEMASPDSGTTPSRAVKWDIQGDGGQRILGSIEVGGRAAVLSANSMPRAKRGQALLTAVLDGLVGQPMTALQSLDRALEERRGNPPPESPLLPEETAEVLRATFEQHYRQTLDTPIPFFDGKSPRQAAKTKRGKERVVAWLKHLENGDARRSSREGQPSYDFSWMWEELGVSQFRG
ncbi:MAG: hypothetical protein EPN20_04990 [Magnetospirillum sp.]|nr:MAG: hypothetical protein EPN20_04990 [Magnetospirillum sp.]